MLSELLVKLLPGASTRVKIDETEEMLIGIVVRSVTSKKSCALDGSPSCERNARHMASRRWKTDLKFEIRWTLRSLTNVKIKYSYWLPVVLALKRIPVFVFYPYFDVFWFRRKYRFLLFLLVYYRCKLGV